IVILWRNDLIADDVLAIDWNPDFVGRIEANALPILKLYRSIGFLDESDEVLEFHSRAFLINSIISRISLVMFEKLRHELLVARIINCEVEFVAHIFTMFE